MDHQGVGPVWSPDHEPIETKYHAWHLWLGLILFGQAVWYIFPAQLWARLEGGKINLLVQNLHNAKLENMVVDVKDDNEKDKKEFIQQRRSLVLYFAANLGQNNFYGAQYVLMEILNLANVITQAYFMNAALDGEFFNYGLQLPELLNKNWTEREDKFVTVSSLSTK